MFCKNGLMNIDIFCPFVLSARRKSAGSGGKHEQLDCTVLRNIIRIAQCTALLETARTIMCLKKGTGGMRMRGKSDAGRWMVFLDKTITRSHDIIRESIVVQRVSTFLTGWTSSVTHRSSLSLICRWHALFRSAKRLQCSRNDYLQM